MHTIKYNTIMSLGPESKLNDNCVSLTSFILSCIQEGVFATGWIFYSVYEIHHSLTIFHKI